MCYNNLHRKDELKFTETHKNLECRQNDKYNDKKICI